jgi:DNA-binding MarR family transcriptional regulator
MAEVTEIDTPLRRRSYASRWKHAELVQDGYLVVPSAYLRHYATLKPFPLTSGEALFVLQLMGFKWDEAAPFPGYKTLAARLGISDKMARRHAQSLETKGYLRRQMRVGLTNLFDLTPLFDALLQAHLQDRKAPRRRRTSRRETNTAST